MENYQAEVLKTLASSATYENHVSQSFTEFLLAEFVGLTGIMEVVKKQIAYGKDLPEDLPVDPYNLNKDEIDILHAKLGIAGEAGEVIEATTTEEVKKEVGDLLWYIAVLLHKHNLDFPEVMQGNIDKLRLRYASGGYTRAEALSRWDMA